MLENYISQLKYTPLQEEKIKGWYFDFNRDSEKWFAMILDASIQGQGFGRQILNQAKEKESELNGWVIDHNNDLKANGEYYKSPIGFYLKNADASIISPSACGFSR